MVVILKCENCEQNKSRSLQVDENEQFKELLVIFRSYAVIEPFAMMIEIVNASKGISRGG